MNRVAGLLHGRLPIGSLRWPQWVLCLLGVGLIAWCAADPRLRDASGFPTAGIGLGLAGGVALIVAGWLFAGPFARSAFWFGLALIGQAAALQLIDAGRLLHYQHLRPWMAILTASPHLLALLTAQTLAVTGGAIRYGPSIVGWWRTHIRWWQTITLALALLVPSTALSRDVGAYFGELAAATLLAAVQLVNVVLIVASLPTNIANTWLGGLARSLDVTTSHLASEPRHTVRWLPVAAALWVTVVAAGLSYAVYQRHPHIPDEAIYYFQARYFASGVLTVPAPPVPDAFSLYMIPYRSAEWYSPFPPGWPAVLAVGMLVGVPWLVNPLLAGLNVLLAYAFVREVYDERLARHASLLLACSPWFIFMGMNFMSHTFMLAAALGAAVALSWARKTGQARWAWLSGAAVGVLSLTRPLDAAVIGGLLGLWAIGWGGGRLKPGALAAFGLGVMLVAALMLPYNYMLTGHALRDPLNAYYEEYFGHNTFALGFGPERGLSWPLQPLPGHSPLSALINGLLNLHSLNTELAGWPIGSLGLVALVVVSRPVVKRDRLMLAAIGAIAAAYSLFWYSGGPDFGARYWYLAIVPLVTLTTRGVRALGSLLVRTWGAARARSVLMAGVAALCSMALVNYLPWRALDKYYHYLNMQPGIRELAAANDFGRSIVLIQGQSHPDYASAWTYNPLVLDADGPLYAWDAGPELRREVLRAFGDRPVWVVAGPSLTGQGYQLVAGPLRAADLLRDTLDHLQSRDIWAH